MTPRQSAGDGALLLALSDRAGFSRVDTPVLQPAEIFLDLSGEDIRRRLYLTQDATGREFCLRPEWTIPVCRTHIEAGRQVGDYSYFGPVFRHRDDGSGEFMQAGIESLGRPDREPADADVLGIAVDGFSMLGGGAFQVRLGDLGLLDTVMAALAVPGSARRRLIRALAAGRTHDDVLRLDSGAPEGSDYSGLLAAIQGQDPKAARAFVEDVIRIAGVATVGGRTAGEIAERFLSKAENRSGILTERARSVLARYLALAGDLDDTADALQELAREEDLPIGAAIEAFQDRIGFIAARGIDLSRLRFEADFVRTLDYYTGMIFELRSSSRPAGQFLVAGGRYDRLLDQLGSRVPVPAVGCSFWLDRFEEASR